MKNDERFRYISVEIDIFRKHRCGTPLGDKYSLGLTYDFSIFSFKFNRKQVYLEQVVEYNYVKFFVEFQISKDKKK